MRSVFSGSYSALNNPSGIDENEGLSQDVYRSTTRASVDCGDVRPPQQKFNVLNSVRKLFGGNGRGRLTASQSVYVLPNIHESSTPNGHSGTSRQRSSGSGGVNYSRLQQSRDRTKRMPTSISMEEAALLGTQAYRCNPSESMDEVELKNIQLSFPSARTLCRGQGLATEERVETKFGSVLVGIQGDRSKPVIVTYHDLGLNYVSNFQAFFNFVDMRLLLQNFCVYHINAPGQEEGAATLSESFIYPTMDELAEQVYEVITNFGIRRIIGFGVGAGANILCRFALTYPDKIDALCVINCLSTQTGWIEWGYQKLNARHLRTKGTMTQGVNDYLMWHHFGSMTEERNHDLTHVYRQYFETQVNPVNLGLFIDSYIRRTDLDITRELDPLRKNDVRTIRAAVLNVTGALSPHVDDTVTFNGRLDPVNSTWMKLQDCGMVLEEQPAKLSEAFRLFIQGQGYAIKLFRKNSLPEVPCLSSQKIAMNRKTSVDSGAGSNSTAGSSGSLNAFSAPKLQPASGILIHLNNEVHDPILESGNGSPGSSDSGLTNEPEAALLEQGIKNIHITENPISESKEQLDVDAQNNPKC